MPLNHDKFLDLRKKTIDNSEPVQYTKPEILIEDKEKKSKWSLTLKFLAYLSVFSAVTLAFFSCQTLISGQGSTSWWKNISFVKPLQYLVESADRKMKGEENDRINLLLLGMGGENHSGGYLTDTIILVSIQPSTKKVSMLSIPRDLTVPIEGAGWKKINAINAYAEQKDKGSGGNAVCQAIGDLLDIKIDYFVRADFAGFMKVIDELGGVKVYVDNTLEDFSYPVLGKEEAYPYSARYEHLYIEKGWQEMDGSLALKYARSRHGVGAEGSDFARAKRQQKIIEAAKDKILSANMLLKPLTVKNIISAVNDHVATNLEVWEMLKLWDLVKDINKDQIINKVLDNSANGLLVNAVGDGGAYILTPRSGDFNEIQYLVKNVFSNVSSEKKTKVNDEMATVEVKNGTWINGLGGKVAVDLEKYGFDVIKITNCSRQNFQKSVIYDLTYGEKIESLKILKEKTGANVSFDLPEWLIEDLKRENSNKQNPQKPDYILIIGEDAGK